MIKWNNRKQTTDKGLWCISAALGKIIEEGKCQVAHCEYIKMLIYKAHHTEVNLFPRGSHAQWYSIIYLAAQELRFPTKFEGKKNLVTDTVHYM